MEKQKLLVKRKSRKGKGKIIGNAFQREICKKLSLACSNGEHDDIFISTSGSGSRGTIRKKAGKKTQVTQHGDIDYENPMGKPLINIWSIECKTGYGTTRKTKEGITKSNWCLLDCIEGGSENPMFLDFWLQTLEDAETSKREPILIFRRNNKQPCIVFKKEYWNYLMINYISLFNIFPFDNIILNISGENLIIISFKDFLTIMNRNLLEFAKMSIQIKE